MGLGFVRKPSWLLLFYNITNLYSTDDDKQLAGSLEEHCAQVDDAEAKDR